ncbi:MAG: hypothetical protein D6682_02805, partial [Zetaproteobacteria bacterium]
MSDPPADPPTALGPAASFLVVLIALLALGGWAVDHAALAAAFPPIADMTFNTALAFLLLATALLLPAGRAEGEARRRLRMLLAAAVALFAALSLIEDLFSVDLAIDNLLFHTPPLETSSPHPGRMSPLTATAFLLSAGALLLLARRGDPAVPAVVVHAMILTVGLTGLVGFAMHLLIREVPPSQRHLFSISEMTALAFLLLAA